MSSMPPAHARGYAGEQSMGFFLGERGYFFVEGPSGSAGHGVTAPGFDGVAFNSRTRHLIIYDNKAFASDAAVSRAKAVERSGHFARNLDRLITRVEAMPELPHKAMILDRLREAKFAVDRHKAWPGNVTVAVSNASGQSTNVSERLSESGIRFIDYYRTIRFVDRGSAPRPIRRFLAGQHGVAILGVALESLFLSLGDIGIEREIKRRCETELAQEIESILGRGQGVLVVVAYREWEVPDFNGMRGRGLLSVSVLGGMTQEEAQRNWEGTPRLLQGPPKGWRVFTRYGWIPPAPG